MRQVIAKLKPASGFGRIAHGLSLVLLALSLFVLVRVVRSDFIQLALAIVLLSKWRMFAVRPRYWPANLRANGVDILIGLSVIIFMIHTDSRLWQLTWTAAYGAWLIGLKPRSDTLSVSAQAALGQLTGMTALFLQWSSAPLYALVLAAGAIGYVAAHHFFDSFEEPYARLLAYCWGYFAAGLSWVLGHWLLFYGVFAQPVILISSLGYGFAALYYFDHFEKLTKLVRREFIFVMVAIVTVVLALANWGSKVI